ncbi:MAG: Obg family GTPase CgtA, partial [Clostridia bacterium]|nr:Obg family GTPase CgtA [Clostridia bacterium]
PIAHGTQELVYACAQKLRDLPPVKAFEPDPVVLPDPETLAKDRVPQITMRGDLYEVTADWLLPILRTIDIDDYESLQYFQRVLISSGVIKALEDAGIEEGDIVSLYDFEFEFIR